MPNARTEILNRIRAAAAPEQTLPVEEPATDREAPDAGDRVSRFADAVAEVGGRCIRVSAISEVESHLERIPAYVEAHQILSRVQGVGVRANVDIDAMSDPHELRDLDFAILPGQLGVAENGAVWVDGRGLRHRSAYFLTQHLALVISANAIVHDLHRAYERIDFAASSFGTFIAGPSKTADIEQALVIGAHGPRSHVVFTIG